MPDCLVKAWVLDSEPREYVGDAFLEEHGVKYWKIDADNWKEEGLIDKICEERNYWNRGVKTTTKEMTLEYHTEHLHEQDEIWFSLDGGGYIDMRDMNERWIRVDLAKGILMVFPAGVYHRLTLEQDFVTRLSIRATRKVDPGETGLKYHYRPADDIVSRPEYLKRLKAGDFP